MVETNLVKKQEKQMVDEKSLPGHVPSGMEQQGGMADAQYRRWLEGLKGRCGIV